MIKKKSLKQQLKPINFSLEDIKYYLIYELEDEVKREEIELRRKYNYWILVGSLSSFASLMMGYGLCSMAFPVSSGQVQTFQSFTSFNFILFSCLGGLFVDFLSIKSTWYFLTLTSICCQFLIQIAAISDIPQISILCQIIILSMYPIYYINFICVLYETADQLKNRLNNAIKLEIYGVLIPIAIGHILYIFSNAYYQNDEISRFQLNKIFIYIGVSICLIMNGLSIIILQKTYKQIQIIRDKSTKYSYYSTFQGLGLSLFKIIKYFKNKDILYLCSISSICGYHCGTMGLTLTLDIQYYNILRIFSMAAGCIIAYLISNTLNSSKKIVTTSYKSLQKCLYLLAIIRIIQIVCLYLIDYDVLYSNDLLHYIPFSVLLILQVIVYILLCAQIHQMVVFLLPPNCRIRGTSLSITFFIYFIFYLIVFLIGENKQLLYIFSLSHISPIILYDYYYQKKKKFSFLDRQLSQQNQIFANYQ